MRVAVYKDLDQIIPGKYRKLRKIMSDLYQKDYEVYCEIENDIIENFRNTPDEDEVADYIVENFKNIVRNYSSDYIPEEYYEDDDWD